MTKIKKNTLIAEPQTNANKKVTKSKKIKPIIKKISVKMHPMDSDLRDDVKHGLDNYLKISNENYCNSVECLNENNKASQKLLEKMTSNISRAMNEQMHFGMKALSCTTIVDFISLFQQNFKDNFDHIMKLNSDFFSLMNHASIKNYQHTADCARKSAKIAGSKF